MLILRWFSFFHQGKADGTEDQLRNLHVALIHIGSLISMYATLGAQCLSQVIFFSCILCFQTSTCLKCRDCALHHNNTLESALLLSFLVVRICEASCTSYSIQALGWPMTWTTCSVSAQRQRGRKAHSTTKYRGRICYCYLLIRSENSFLFILFFTHTGTCEDERAYNQQRRGHGNF